MVENRGDHVQMQLKVEIYAKGVVEFFLNVIIGKIAHEQGQHLLLGLFFQVKFCKKKEILRKKF